MESRHLNMNKMNQHFNAKESHLQSSPVCILEFRLRRDLQPNIIAGQGSIDPAALHCADHTVAFSMTSVGMRLLPSPNLY